MVHLLLLSIEAINLLMPILLWGQHMNTTAKASLLVSAAAAAAAAATSRMHCYAIDFWTKERGEWWRRRCCRSMRPRRRRPRDIPQYVYTRARLESSLILAGIGRGFVVVFFAPFAAARQCWPDCIREEEETAAAATTTRATFLRQEVRRISASVVHLGSWTSHLNMYIENTWGYLRHRE